MVSFYLNDIVYPRGDFSQKENQWKKWVQCFLN